MAEGFMKEIENTPDLMKSYLFTVDFNFGDDRDKMSETLRLRAKAVETSPVAKNQMAQFTLTFDECQDFKVFPFWYEQLPDAGKVTEEEFEKSSFTVTVRFYNSKLDKEIGQMVFNSVTPAIIQPLVFNQEGDGKTQLKVTFMCKNVEIPKAGE